MYAKKITRTAVLLAVATALTVTAEPLGTAGTAQAAAAARTIDFNGDGYGDLAVGTPAFPGMAGLTGAVTVLYGSPTGFNGHTVRRPPPGCKPGPWSATCSRWGMAVVAGDLDADARTDLLFSARYPRLQLDSWKSGGVVTTTVPGDLYYGKMWGSTIGQFDDQPGADIITINDLTQWSGDTEVISSDLRTGYNGADWTWKSFDSTDSANTVGVRSAATGDTNGDGKQELAVVIGKFDWETGLESAPYLWLITDTTKSPMTRDPGLQVNGSYCTPENRHVRGCPKPDSQVAMGDVDGDGRMDVVMATPSTLSLQVWYGRDSGFIPSPDFSAHDIAWFPKGAGAGPSQDLTVGDVNGDGAAEIVIGSPNAASSGQAAAGAVAVIPGSKSSPRGPVLSAAQIITQDAAASGTPPTPTPKPTPTDPPPFPTEPPSESFNASQAAAGPFDPDPIGEQSQAGDRFGESVRVLDVTGDGKGEVIVGAPGKNGGNGMLAVLHGTGANVWTVTAQIVHPDQFGLGSPQTAFGKIMTR